MKVFREYIREDTVPYSAFMISRVSMPQINNADGFKNFLAKNGIAVNTQTQSVDDLKPTQTDYDQNKVDSMVNDIKSGKKADPIIASNDGFVMDGHHRYQAAAQTDTDTSVMNVDLPINKLLKVAYNYSNTGN